VAERGVECPNCEATVTGWPCWACGWVRRSRLRADDHAPTPVLPPFPPQLQVGQTLYGFCGGYFGRDSYHDKRVEAVGADWVVVRRADFNRENGDYVEFAQGQNIHETLSEYTRPER
jgi:hypothetical protein